jgi:hypothetical protein
MIKYKNLTKIANNIKLIDFKEISYYITQFVLLLNYILAYHNLHAW